MKKTIVNFINNFVSEYQKKDGINTSWKTPIVGFADAENSLFEKVKNHISKDKYLLPKDILDSANTVVSYFIPFDESIANSNIEGRNASLIWARSYYETNELLKELAEATMKFLKKEGYNSNIPDGSYIFDRINLIGYWSQRHTAYIAGLGTFGINNMLITEKGCCGRYGSFVTNAKIEATETITKEYCIYKYNKKCGKCVDVCQENALDPDGEFKRFDCVKLGNENAKIYEEFASPQVCGKCLVGMPCSFTNPIK